MAINTHRLEDRRYFEHITLSDDHTTYICGLAGLTDYEVFELANMFEFEARAREERQLTNGQHLTQSHRPSRHHSGTQQGA